MTDGVARGVAGDSHQWRSQSLEPEKATLTLDFGRARELNELHLAFDTALSRALTLSHDNWLYRQMIPGVQPETVCDYTLEGYLDGGWKMLEEVRGNFQRKRVHKFKALRCEQVRITARKTNGVPEARIYEVRCC